MNVEERIKTKEQIPLDRRTIIHMMLVNNTINEQIAIALKPFDISIQQFNVLRILRGQKGKPANLSTLNERMVTRMSNTTRLVDKLMSKGYVDRITCPSNRRKVEINLTKKGTDKLLEMDKTMAQTEAALLNQFSDSDMKQLNLLLNKF
ncbi:MAG: MarR family transcriptional regulator [Maribacter sp.]|nr:MarR family transcriptional regulator [Maribacter sp.]NND79296.1 MarR family transcriptional regulator [Maribacter sp.]NNK17843.1 MarR family transcriptional regulator [Maribacter sp.]